VDLHYDHPVLLLQHMLWHEGYHHGQIKLALKISGCPLSETASLASHASGGRWTTWREGA